MILTAARLRLADDYTLDIFEITKTFCRSIQVSTPRFSNKMFVLLEHLFFLMEYGMLEGLRHRLPAYPMLSLSPKVRSEWRISMTQRQMAFGVICFLVGILVGMKIAGNLDVLIRLVIVVAILLLCMYLVLPYLPQSTRVRRGPAHRVPQRRTQRKP